MRCPCSASVGWCQPPDLDALPSAELKALVIALPERVAALERTVTAQRDEVARLKGAPGRLVLKPGGMANATQLKSPSGTGKHGRGAKKTPRRSVAARIGLLAPEAWPGWQVRSCLTLDAIVAFMLNADRRQPIPKQTFKVTNWHDDDASLRQRGSLTVYGKRAKAEMGLPGFKQVIGDSLRSHQDERQASGVEAAVHVLNRMIEPGHPNSARIA